ncbi:Putative toxin subunit [Pseudomonas chlororaphis]|uniref:Toxin subunit n=1 Tax=Pseudomonas chlororaphis TaxID=587753 RepID=A0A3G7TTW4_9PSED|nr:SpvB/TcaC N-terminal domain-containing protein [Pseudomonas chlororaphis]AZE50341.1 Putative toxin subunit [Pseudomonas chlororaphis]
MNTNGQDTVAVSLPSLPKGGGSISGMGETLTGGGMTGAATLTIPLPVTPGRGYAPNLSLAYNSSQGNGAFGIGWGVPLLTIQRRTSKGVPRYLGNDDYLAPNGEVMVAELDASGAPLSTQVSQYGGLPLGQTYTVTRYFPRVMDDFDRIERWQDQSGREFWLIHGSDGQLHCLGKQPESRIADPSDPENKVGQWLLDESCTPNGEHICYFYRAENTTNVDMQGQEAQRTQTANRYLVQVRYGNATPYTPLYAWGGVPAADQPQWLFTLMFDYGERTLDALLEPSWTPTQTWPCRRDSFSDYSLGFEVRTHRLCHQVLMFHHFPAELGNAETLVSRLLLRYEQTPQLSRLLTAQSLAYESDGALQSLPPLELSYTAFRAEFSSDNYQDRLTFSGWNDGIQYQLVDLYGEGVPGVLYQLADDWRYQSPQRGDGAPDVISYSAWESLPTIPSMSPGHTRLMDLSGDGRLDWIVAQPLLAGYFTLNPDRQWSHFIPFPAFPVEFLQESAQLADLVGGGLSDLALIGPKSVRLYPNHRSAGFGRAMNVAHTDAQELPVFDHDPAALVAFSDVLGSGQSHLVSIRYNALQCWPNLGWGRFGQCLNLNAPQFNPETFNPTRVFLADIDGSGATDLIYAESDHFKIYMNQSGNGFATEPLILPMPTGVRYDMLDQVSWVDLEGTGTASLVLTISHMTPAHWSYPFSATKPYLLQSINNNLGAATTLTYRSSAQEWLDEKKANPNSVCHLPFPLPLLASTVSLDEVTGNRLSQTYHYRQGVYAGVDREFRGFGYVEHWDTNDLAVPTRQDLPNTAPALTKSWFDTGLEQKQTTPACSPYQDPAMFQLGPPRFTTFNPATGDDELLETMDSSTRYQLYRALKGRVLRVEVYDADDASSQNSVPYSVQTWQYQVRLVQSTDPTHPYCVALPSQLEELTVTYDRIASDPQVHQTVCLKSDAFGAPIWSVDLSYARRVRPSSNPYLPAVPDNQWLSSYDDSQQALRIVETRQTLYNLIEPHVWHLGLPYQQRQNVITAPSGYSGYPANATGLDYTTLRLPNGVLGANQTRVLAGQEVTYYFNASGTAALPVGTPPPPLALTHHVDTAELDEEMLLVYGSVTDLTTALSNAGYSQQPVVLAETGATPAQVWVISHDYTGYVDATGAWLPFCLPRTQQRTLIVGAQHLEYDTNYCVVNGVIDALGNTTRATYNYKFLKPWQVIDPNLNRQEVLFDALGRVLASSFYGTQLASDNTPSAVGFAPVSEFNTQAPPLSSIDTALTDPAGALQNAATVSLYDPYSWMGTLPSSALLAYVAPDAVAALWQVLQDVHLITASGQLLAKGRRWAENPSELPEIPMGLSTAFQSVSHNPVHSAVLAADQFPDSASAAQIQIMLVYSDGFGRNLQSQQKTVPGLALVISDDGQLTEDAFGQPLILDTTPNDRWIVSGRVDYNNKGLPVHRYQPYFVDQPRYVNDSSTRQWGYADTYYYDPLSRERLMVTALGYQQRQSYYPWFSIVEDLNDTLNEVLSS